MHCENAYEAITYQDITGITYHHRWIIRCYEYIIYEYNIHEAII